MNSLHSVVDTAQTTSAMHAPAKSSDRPNECDNPLLFEQQMHSTEIIFHVSCVVCAIQCDTYPNAPLTCIDMAKLHDNSANSLPGPKSAGEHARSSTLDLGSAKIPPTCRADRAYQDFTVTSTNSSKACRRDRVCLALHLVCQQPSARCLTLSGFQPQPLRCRTHSTYVF